MSSSCDHDNYSSSPDECDIHPDKECYVRTCDNCNKKIEHVNSENGVDALDPEKYDRVKDRDDINKKFHDIVSKIQFDEDK